MNLDSILKDLDLLISQLQAEVVFADSLRNKYPKNSKGESEPPATFFNTHGLDTDKTQTGFEGLRLYFHQTPSAPVESVNRHITDCLVDLFVRTFSLFEYEVKRVIIDRKLTSYQKFPNTSDRITDFIKETKWQNNNQQSLFENLKKVRDWGIHNNFIAYEDLEFEIDGIKFVFLKNLPPHPNRLSDILKFSFTIRHIYQQWLEIYHLDKK